MIKILFICHGNICRSPMAEFVLKKKVEELGIADRFYIASAATSTEEIWNGVGNPVYPPAKAELAKHGISCEGKRAIQLKKSDYDDYDYDSDDESYMDSGDEPYPDDDFDNDRFGYDSEAFDFDMDGFDDYFE